MTFNHNMFKPSKIKKPYLGPPRPNLLTHEKKMKESAEQFADMVRIMNAHQEEISKLKNKIAYLENTINTITVMLRKK